MRPTFTGGDRFTHLQFKVRRAGQTVASCKFVAAVVFAVTPMLNLDQSFNPGDVIIAGLWAASVLWLSTDTSDCRWPFSSFSSFFPSSSLPLRKASRIQWNCILFSLAQYAYTKLQAVSRASRAEFGGIVPGRMGWGADSTVVCQLCAYGFLAALCVDVYAWWLLEMSFVKVLVQVRRRGRRSGRMYLVCVFVYVCVCIFCCPSSPHMFLTSPYICYTRSTQLQVVVSFATFVALFGGPGGSADVVGWAAALLHGGIVAQVSAMR